MATKPPNKSSPKGDGSYGEASIRVLKGLEPVKQRPGMCTRTDNPLHIIQEVIDNAADEALAGHGKRIDVTLHTDGSVSVQDDGRGIPFGMHPEEKVPVVEIVFTRLHAGGKFDKGSGGAYSFSGGLHGVGVSVTNALAKRLEVTVWRDSQVAELAFAGGGETENFAEGEGAAWCVAFTEDGSPVRESYVNLIPTVAGGTHESGLKDGLFGAVKGFIDLHSLLPKGVKLMPEDVFSRANFVLSAKVLDPQFQGQIKERLNSRDALRLVSTYVKPAMELWLNQHVDLGKKLAELVIKQAQTRQRAGQKVEKRKGSGVAVLPGKLTDCESKDTAHNEVFLVEGDSAGGSAKMGRDKESQAILPLRGKVLNTWEVERDRLLANPAILDKLRKDGVRENAWTISRFKGLGEMSAEQLWETTLNPDTRRLLQVRLGRFDLQGTQGEITKLMGKGEAAARRELMELRADD